MRFILAFLATISCVACSGYRVGPVKPTKLAGIEKICVRNFKNETLEPRLESLLANAVIKQIHLDGTYKTTDASRADAILDGTLLRIDRLPARAVRGNILQTSEYLVIVTATYRLTNARTGALLDTRSVTGTTNFFVTGGSSGQDILVADTRQDERTALPLAIDDMAVRITSLVSEGW